MNDPLDALRLEPAPADPDPDFAARLRSRLERALDLPRGVSAVTDTVTPPREAAADTRGPTVGAAVPYLNVRDARAALDWYVEVLGAVPAGEPHVLPDGQIGHAELALGGGVLYLAEGDYPEIGVAAADPGASTASVSLLLGVAGLDRVLAGARDAGAWVVREPYEGYGSRNATIFDPFGHRWMLMEPVPAGAGSSSGASAAARVRYRHGDIAYMSLWVPDVDRAAVFYRSVFGWEVTGDGPGRHVRSTLPPQGVWTVEEPPSVFCCYAVDDVVAACARVGRSGGVAGRPVREPYGTVAMCTDDQGTRFALVQLPAPAEGEEDAADPPPHGRRPGDVAYLTILTPDSEAARAFYGAVLGWEFTPGRSADGWNIERVAPMAGLGGGADRAAVRPMYLVHDIEAAADRVRDAGGNATVPVPRPYGLEAECSDDQGLWFYLGQL